jgi:hypothetical protein
METLLACLAGFCLTSAEPTGSYLTTMTQGPDGKYLAGTEPYIPHEGDIVLYNDHSPVWDFLYHYVGSDLPDHSGLVVKLVNGETAVLESGPDDGKNLGLHVFLLETLPRLQQYKGQWHGAIYIRRIKQPLTPEQSAALTEWSAAQTGKHYATWRLLLQGTPIRCRSGLRETIFARTYDDRQRWLCCELVVAGLAHIGVLDRNVIKGNRTYPRDVLYDDHFDISATHLPAGEWTPERPQALEPIPAQIAMEPKTGVPCCLPQPRPATAIPFPVFAVRPPLLPHSAGHAEVSEAGADSSPRPK